MAQWPSVQVQSPSVYVQSPSMFVQSPSVYVQSPSGYVQSPSMYVQSPSVHVQYQCAFVVSPLSLHCVLSSLLSFLFRRRPPLDLGPAACVIAISTHEIAPPRCPLFHVRAAQPSDGRRKARSNTTGSQQLCLRSAEGTCDGSHAMFVSPLRRCIIHSASHR